MRPRQQNKKVLFMIMLFSAVLALIITGSVLGQATIPTRTPTPNPEEPTDPPPEPTDDDGNGGNNTPNPTNPPPDRNTSTPVPGGNNTPVPGNTPTPLAPTTAPITTQPNTTATQTTAPGIATTTATSSNIISASATPFGGVFAPGTTPVSFPVVATAFPAAEPCGEPPTFTTLITALVYSGPGNEYEFIQTIASDEVRPIVGRAIYSPWWLIQLDGKGNQAWINDRTGIVQGSTVNLPEVPAPAIGGETPTPGVRWEPTPINECQLTPTTSDTESIASETTSEEGIDVSVNESIDGQQPQTEIDQREIAAATAAPLDIPDASPTPNLLPIAGLILIIAAVFVALFLRRNPGGGDTS